MHARIAVRALLPCLLGVVFAAPPPQAWHDGNRDSGDWDNRDDGDDCQMACMSAQDARQVATNFQTLIANYTDALADAALAPNFIDYSDSVAELINSGCAGPQVLGAPTFPSLAAFKSGQSGQPSIPFEILNVWSNCDTVTVRWKSAQTPELVTGIIVLEAVPSVSSKQYAWQIEAVYSEFNSGAWLVNLDVFKPSNCTAATQP